MQLKKIVNSGQRVNDRLEALNFKFAPFSFISIRRELIFNRLLFLELLVSLT